MHLTRKLTTMLCTVSFDNFQCLSLSVIKFHQVLEEVTANQDIILFIDELHTLMGAGSAGADGGMDAAQLMKPVCALTPCLIPGAGRGSVERAHWICRGRTRGGARWSHPLCHTQHALDTPIYISLPLNSIRHAMPQVLARGELQCIGATTIEEYRRYVEKDAALERRFQPVKVGCNRQAPCSFFALCVGNAKLVPSSVRFVHRLLLPSTPRS